MNDNNNNTQNPMNPMSSMPTVTPVGVTPDATQGQQVVADNQGMTPPPMPPVEVPAMPEVPAAPAVETPVTAGPEPMAGTVPTMGNDAPGEKQDDGGTMTPPPAPTA